MDKLESFRNYLKNCKSIISLCGAGLSASSGLPTFRGSGGLWKNYSSIDLATPDAFHTDAGLVWQFYTFRRHAALKAKPNNGHKALSKLSYLENINYLTLTQNVDNASRIAKHNPKKLLELHGNLFTLSCTNFMCTFKEEQNYNHPLTPALADCEDEFSEGSFQPVKEIPESELPHCPRCNTGLLRPGVVWFGEPLPLKVIDKVDEFLVKNDPINLILVIGTSQSVWPAAAYIDRVKQQGGKVAVFNTEIPDMETVENKNAKGEYQGWAFKGDAAITLPLALEALIGKI
ncbi:hypothetical protein PACTADRAFT_39813 [Pachysolen tannophilus NRRL Y-2460]|uniref:Deacetylase sirtuin-type domain-containing protein n=1 Tax=Pachysolen tannophilus NRRL Y-2460 TaxID=669874 RepID=A0A1E4TZ11_PACTA|nr:hypothetical protein PACTADRAFT_39813 [Pachysolen tannophilus NRRL Y-2460]